MNPPAVRVLGHFFGDYRKGRLESGFFRLGDHFRQDEAARIAIGLHGRTGEFFLKDFPGIAYFRRCQIQNRLCTFPLGGPPGSWVQVADGVAAQGGAVIQHFLNLGGAHGRTAARDEFGVWENGKGESRFFQYGIGVRVDALPAVIDGDHDAFGRKLPVPQFPFQEFLHGDDGHSGRLQRLHLGAEYIRIHAHFRSGKGAAEIMVTQNGYAGFRLRNRNGGKSRGGNGKGCLRRLYRGVQVRFPGNGFRVRDGLRQGSGRACLSGNGFRHGDVFILAVGFNQVFDGNDAGVRVSLDGSPDDRAGSKGKGRRRRQVGRKLRTCDTGCDQENGKEAWDGAHICNYYF